MPSVKSELRSDTPVPKSKDDNTSDTLVTFSTEFCTTDTNKYCSRLLIVMLYASVTILDLIRGIIHTFLYEAGLNDVSGLSTGNSLCDNRLSAIMIGYGGANLESFLIRSYILYVYVRYDSGREFLRVTSMASVLCAPVTEIVASVGNIDVGGAEVPGRYAMVIRSVASLGTLLLTFL